jgi:hypothetical protein
VRSLGCGSLVSAALWGAWRAAAAPFAGSEDDLVEATPLLIHGGAAGLAWWRIRDTPLSDTTCGRALRDRYRRQAVRASIHASAVAGAVGTLREAGVDPILGKGWAAALNYPHPGFRPDGDIDLYVHEDQHGLAREALATAEGSPFPVDLHRGFADGGRPWREAQKRSRLVRVCDTEVRIFGEEEHLRLLIAHLLRHGAWRPLWLCDVASALEHRAPEFDWDRVLHGDRRAADWIACTTALAHRLLGVDMTGVPARVAEQHVPRWLITSVLRQWGTPSFVPQGRRVPMRTVLRHDPWNTVDAVLMRWPNAVEATVGVGGSPHDGPRLPFQLAECLRRGAAHLAGMAAG